MQRAELRIADGRFMAPGGELDDAAVAELAAAAATAPDWSFLNDRSPALYPVVYWGLATLPADLSSQGTRGLYVRDTGGCPWGWGLHRQAGGRPTAGLALQLNVSLAGG